ncbi:hypothetical protein [Streptomyces sp. P17]|uniref:hypothetical protein n=1 Tax=Streptomyces sp. P17 TaxID=3074716 RepID=UPI0028F3EB98|nr:hypothetical protein [Streptomyces sp. P17]MDT9696710.1 hypothetical protein [Streptomyces sp. P17]
MTSGIPPLGSPLWRVGFRLMMRYPRRIQWSYPFDVALVLFMSVWVGSLPPPTGNVWQAGVLAAVSMVLWCLMEAGGWIEVAACGPTGVLRNAALYVAFLIAMVALLTVGSGLTYFSVSLLCWVLLMFMGAFRGPVGYMAFLLWNRPRLPLRLARFLDWSVTAGLMRTSGVAYQFRHREFQEWLVRNPVP